MIDAPVESIWDLIGNPARHPEWWPRVVEVEGKQFSQGDQYVQVTRSPTGSVQTTFLVESREDLKEVRLRCLATGTYAHWVLTGAQGGTFVDLEMGMDPKGLSNKLFDAAVGRRYFKRWAEESIDGLERAVAPSRA